MLATSLEKLAPNPHKTPKGDAASTQPSPGSVVQGPPGTCWLAQLTSHRPHQQPAAPYTGAKPEEEQRGACAVMFRVGQSTAGSCGRRQEAEAAAAITTAGSCCAPTCRGVADSENQPTQTKLCLLDVWFVLEVDRDVVSPVLLTPARALVPTAHTLVVDLTSILCRHTHFMLDVAHS